MRPPVLFENVEECCGCTACFSACARSAIVMEKDNEGFYYPQIIIEKCIGCYNCIRVCPLKKQKEIKSKNI